MHDNPLVGALVSLAAAIVSLAVPVVVPILVPALLRRLKLANDAELCHRLEVAAEAAAGVAYQYAAAKMQTNATGLASPDVHQSAINAGVAYVAQHMPTTLSSLNVSPEKMADMINARLGKLLAADPSVSAGQPAALTPPPRSL
jgi:hypothetical protein